MYFYKRPTEEVCTLCAMRIIQNSLELEAVCSTSAKYILMQKKVHSRHLEVLCQFFFRILFSDGPLAQTKFELGNIL